MPDDEVGVQPLTSGVFSRRYQRAAISVSQAAQPPKCAVIGRLRDRPLRPTSCRTAAPDMLRRCTSDCARPISSIRPIRPDRFRHTFTLRHEPLQLPSPCFGQPQPTPAVTLHNQPLCTPPRNDSLIQLHRRLQLDFGQLPTAGDPKAKKTFRTAIR